MKTIIGYEKKQYSLKAIYKNLDNAPKCQHSYIEGKLWIFGIGVLFECEKTAEKKREKKYERLTKVKFFDKTFFGNVAKYNYKKTIESL